MPNWKANNPGCACCNPYCPVGWEQGYQTGTFLDLVCPLAQYDRPAEIRQNIRSTISYLADVAGLVAGYRSHPNSYFASGDWDTVANWVDAGGRLYYGYTGAAATADRSHANNFLAAIGSAISVGTSNLNPGGTALCQLQAVGLTSGYTSFNYSFAANLSGGTACALSSVADGSVPILSVEAVGLGFVLVGAVPTLMLRDFFSNPAASLLP